MRELSRGDYLPRHEVIQHLHDEFIRFDPAYIETKRIMEAELDELSVRLNDIQAKEDVPLHRSGFIKSEADWLLNYTCDWNRLHRRLHDLRRSLETGQWETEDQKMLVARPDDGSFGAGATEWFGRLDATTDAVQEVPLKYPLTFLVPLLSPGRLLARLHELQVSHIAKTGINHRAELASIESSMSQFLFKDGMRQHLADPALWNGAGPDEIQERLARLKQVYGDFLDQSQHPRTGYWGPWYILDGELIKMQDLSYTFHIVSYTKGKVRRWPEILHTTLQIKQEGYSYPYGWKPSNSDSPYSNHHNNDVIKIFWAGREHIRGAALSRQIGDAIFTMLEWCLTDSLCKDPAGNPYADFQQIGDEITMDRYYFGVVFLNLAGFWRDEPFWWNPHQLRPPTWPQPKVVAQNLLAAVLKLRTDTSYAKDVIDILHKALGDLPQIPDTPAPLA